MIFIIIIIMFNHVVIRPLFKNNSHKGAWLTTVINLNNIQRAQKAHSCRPTTSHSSAQVCGYLVQVVEPRTEL
jgi:hypothetical protein